MPIRINLLAEAQAARDQRRKDPVKRSIWLAVLFVLLMLAWSSSLQLQSLLAKGELSRIEGELSSRSNEFHGVLEQQNQLNDVNNRLRALTSLATNRLLYGNVLAALQESLVPNVQLVRMRAEQSFSLVDVVKPKTNNAGKITPGRPASSTESTVVLLEARDTAPVPGDQVNVYRRTLADYPYFKEYLRTNEVRLANLSAPQRTPDGKPFVMFSLECKYPEVVR